MRGHPGAPPATSSASSPARVVALRAVEPVDVAPDRDFDDIVALASAVCGAPMAIVSLRDEQGQWFDASVGIQRPVTRALAACAHALQTDEMIIVPDTLRDARWSDHALTTGELAGLKVRFYAGAQLVAPDGQQVGTLCVLDTRARLLSEHQQIALLCLARQVEGLLQLRVKNAALARREQEAHLAARRWEAVAEIADAVASSRRYEDVVSTVDATLQSVVPFDSLVLKEVQGDQAMVVAGFNRAGPPAATGTVTAGGGRFEHLWHRETYRIDDVQKSVHAEERAMVQLGIAALVRLPLWSAGALVGSLTFCRSTCSPFSDDEVRMLERVAPHLAHAVANVKAHLTEMALKKTRESLSQLLVHDLKNPLTIAISNLHLVGELPPEEQREALADTHEALDRLSRMILELIDIARSEESGLKATRTVSSVGGLLDAVRDLYRTDCARRRLEVVTHVEAGLTADFDRGLIKRVLENIVGNSTRYARRKVTLEAMADGEELHIAVQNDGPPINEDQRRIIFEKYGQLDIRGNDSTNRGLGLYFCRLAVEAHGGQIRVVNTAGAGENGVRFEITIARAAPAIALDVPGAALTA